MIRKLKENKAMAAIASVLILAAADSVQSRFSSAGKDDVARSRRAETWRRLMDAESTIDSLSNRLHSLEHPSTKKVKR